MQQHIFRQVAVKALEMKMEWPLFLANVAVNACQDLATLQPTQLRTASERVKRNHAPSSTVNSDIQISFVINYVQGT